MCDGITCGNGWYDLIKNCCDELILLENISGIQITFFQVKERMAALRIYRNKILMKHQNLNK
jgi:hypothetical protein